MHQSEHGISAVISQHSGEPLSITGPTPFTETTEPLPAYAGILQTPKGWWGIVVHCPRGTHPQDAVAHYEPHLPPIEWCGNHCSIGMYRLPNRERVVTARIGEKSLLEMKSILAFDEGRDYADSRFSKRRVPAGLRWLPGKQMQLWFSL